MKTPSDQKTVRIVFAVIIVTFGVLRTWIGRYSLCPDGICYLDLADTFASQRWFEAINSYWSPLYPWMLSWVLAPLAPSPKWEVPAAQMVNLFIYLLAFGCFELFVRSILKSARSAAAESDTAPLPQVALLAVGYSLFAWSSLDLIGTADVSPDLLVAAAVYLIAALFVGIQRGAARSTFVMLGIVLGVSYWAKAVMFPLGLVFLGLGWFAVPRNRGRLTNLAIAGLMFALVTAPLIWVLSYKARSFTFGDSGWLNYAAFVSPGGGVRNWQGDPPVSGIPLHPTRLIFQHPRVFEFATPIGGTYPPTYDPRYWNAGRRWTFDLRAQALVVARHSLMYAQLLLCWQSGLLAGALAFLAVGGRPTFGAILGSWPLLAMCVAAFAIYALVHAETRFLGAYVGIAWTAILAGIRLRRPTAADKLVAALLWAVAITIQISVVASTARAWRAEGNSCSALPHVEVAEELHRVGVHAGSRVAVLGDGDWAYWARLAHVRIVAEITTPDTPAFWASAAQQKTAIYEALAKAGAAAVVTAPPLPLVTLDESWARLGHTPYYIRWLNQP
jgi:hypothetical protein